MDVSRLTIAPYLNVTADDGKDPQTVEDQRLDNDAEVQAPDTGAMPQTAQIEPPNQPKAAAQLTNPEVETAPMLQA